MNSCTNGVSYSIAAKYQPLYVMWCHDLQYSIKLLYFCLFKYFSIWIGDFRPISLLGSLYKLISKVSAARLAGVMESIIALNQSAFIRKRHIADGVVVLNKIIDLTRKRKKECLIFKVDFEKAYDSVCWDFLDYMLLHRFGFSVKWRAWIRACVFQGNYPCWLMVALLRNKTFIGA